MLINFFISTCTILSMLFGTIYQYSVPLIEGSNQSLSVYQGKKLLILTLPLVQTPSADSLLYSLDTLAKAHEGTLKVIATPAYEDGFTPAQKSSLHAWYRSKLRAHILITDGIYTRKVSGVQQHGLYRWLTTVTENGRFNMDITQKETKFLINTDGKIYGVMRPHTKIWGQTLNKVINSPVFTEE